MQSVRPLLRRPSVRGVVPKGAAPSRMAPGRNGRGLITTATLHRGRVYFYKGVPFERDKETGITDELLRLHNVEGSVEQFVFELEDLYETVTDSDNDKFEKPIFEVRVNRPAPLSAVEEREAQRPRRIKQFVEVPRRGGDGPRPRPMPRR